MGREPAPDEKRIILTKINWQKYEQLLVEMGSERTSHLTYDRGRLELMNPLPEHERCAKLVESLLLVISDELKAPIQVRRNFPLKRLDLQQAIEPDLSCFYQQSTVDEESTPDLVLEVALTASNLDKLPLYASFGIPEVWRYIGIPNKKVPERKLQIFHLQGQTYVPSQQSKVFPFLMAETVQQFLDQSDTFGLMPALKLLRKWMQEDA